MKLIKLAAIPAIALAAGLGLTACGSFRNAPTVTRTVTAAPAAALTPTPAPTTPAPTTPAPAPARTVYVHVQAPEAAGPTLTNCGMDLYAGPDTSCPFAQNVAGDYSGPGADYAYSPATGLNYTMNCTEGLSTVVCTGGDNAYVQWNS